MDRRAQVRELFHVEFPDELFEVWTWYQALEGPAKQAFHKVLGITLHGPFDVLAGKFDDRQLRYPAVLHWRYQYDPPELFTVMAGNTDGLHWGYWFDDPGRLPPVVASFYARDSFELTQFGSLFVAIEDHLDGVERSTNENRESDRAHKAAYDRDLDAIAALRKRLPKNPADHKRKPTVETPEHMGIVVARELVKSWRLPDEIDRAAILAFVEAEIAAGRPGTALLVGKRLWEPERIFAFDILIRAYEALDRAPLRAVALAHRDYPALPSLDVLSYNLGDYGDLRDALAHAADVKKLELHRSVEVLDDKIGDLTNLVELELGANHLTTLPATLARCTKLETINVYNNRITSLPPALFELPALRVLSLGKNRVTSLDGIEHCRSLRELQLLDNPIERLPADLTGLVGLVELDLSGTFISAEELERIRAALPATKIYATNAGPAKPYSPNTKYVIGDKVTHPTFGAGVVDKLLADGKVSIVFEHVRKTLVHARK